MVIMRVETYERQLALINLYTKLAEAEEELTYGAEGEDFLRLQINCGVAYITLAITNELYELDRNSGSDGHLQMPKFRIYYNKNIGSIAMSYIRILHAVPNAPAVDVYANDIKIARNLPYKGFTNYLQVPAGSYRIELFPSGNTDQEVLTTDLMISDKTITTIAAVGMLPEIELFPILDPAEPLVPGKVCVRFAHLSPNAPAVDITLPDGTLLFADVMYGEVADYLCITPGRFTIQARVAGTDQIVLTVPNIRLLPNRFYTIYAVGLAGETPPLQVLIPLDGNSYLQV